MKPALKVLSLLLCYPDETVRRALPEAAAALRRSNALPAPARRGIETLIGDLLTADPMAAEERYVDLFDRTRSLSLHLFEHVHGDSRARGQAMTDLVALYRRHGMAIAANELPDYVPLFLEFLSLLPEGEARGHLDDAGEIIAGVHGRLAKRRSPYAPAFEALLNLAGRRADADPAQEVEDEDPAAIDRAWEEAPVTFGPEGLAGETASCAKAAAMVARMQATKGSQP
jgi:nitrate reductase delta subunit